MCPLRDFAAVNTVGGSGSDSVSSNYELVCSRPVSLGLSARTRPSRKACRCETDCVYSVCACWRCLNAPAEYIRRRRSFGSDVGVGRDIRDTPIKQHGGSWAMRRIGLPILIVDGGHGALHRLWVISIHLHIPII